MCYGHDTGSVRRAARVVILTDSETHTRAPPPSSAQLTTIASHHSISLFQVFFIFVGFFCAVYYGLYHQWVGGCVSELVSE